MNEERSGEQARLDEIQATAGATGSNESDTPSSSEESIESPAQNDAIGGAVDESADESVEETIELGVALLSHLETDECSLADAIDRIETLTTDPAITREILDTAELRGIIEREDGVVRVTSGSFVRLERDVVRREGEFTCRRCGASLSTGHFVQFDTGEHGPFGSSCIKKVLNRE